MNDEILNGAQQTAPQAADPIPAQAESESVQTAEQPAQTAEQAETAAAEPAQAAEQPNQAQPAPAQAETAPRLVSNVEGVPAYSAAEFAPKHSANCILIPIINEGERILAEIDRAKDSGMADLCDIILCDGGSTDGSMEPGGLVSRGVNTLLVKLGSGRQGAQLRMGIHYALQRGYKGILTIDGNNKDSIESVPLFLQKLRDGYDLVQGSRFVSGGLALNTPKSRYAAVRLIHAPVISWAAGQKFTDTTNAFRAYSRRYLLDARVRPLRDVFVGYELLAYLSVRATQIGLKACEVPVVRAYPKTGKTPTKISGARGNAALMNVLFKTLAGKYNP